MTTFTIEELKMIKKAITCQLIAVDTRLVNTEDEDIKEHLDSKMMELYELRAKVDVVIKETTKGF